MEWALGLQESQEEDWPAESLRSVFVVAEMINKKGRQSGRPSVALPRYAREQTPPSKQRQSKRFGVGAERVRGLLDKKGQRGKRT